MTVDAPDVFVGGRFTPTADGHRVALVDPSTERVFASVAVASSADVDPAVSSARAAGEEWSALSFAQRADVLDRVARVWRARARDIASSVSREMGMPLANSLQSNGEGAARNFEFFADLGRQVSGEEARSAVSFDGTSIVRRSPVGVVAAIAPWNYPCHLMSSKLAPAMAAGCTVVLKPPVENAVTARLMAEVMQEAQVPAGVVNIVVGDVDFAESLVAHPDVSMVAFTGSTAVGRRIGSVVGQRLASVNLELGGKSAAIVLADADLDHTLRELPPLSFRNSGQTCYAQTRVVAVDAVYDAVVEGFASWADRQVLGSAFAETTTLGPLATSAHRSRVRRYLEPMVTGEAVVVAGGLEAPVPDLGFFVAPTVLADVDPGSAVAQEEIFGPVVCLIRASDEDDAVRIANDSEYGLAGSVWTKDLERGQRVARRLETGSVGINGFRPDLSAPFGGVKASGTGRENGREGLDVYLRDDSIYVFSAGTGASGDPHPTAS